MRDARTLRRAALPAALIAFALPGCAPPPDLTTPNFVLITIDTLRADHLGCHGYFRDTSPVLDGFSRECLFFERCLTPIATTFPSHLSLLTSTYPVTHGALGNVGDGGMEFDADGPIRSFAQLAHDAGYLTAGFVSATPVKKYTGIAAGFDSFDAPGRRERDAATTNAAVLPWLDGKARQPFFLWVHYFDPHSPYHPPGEYRTRFGGSRDLDRMLAKRRVDPMRRYPDSPDLSVPEAVNLYDGEVAFVDSQVGRLLDALRSRKDLWRRTVVVIAADHGEGLGQHDDMTHGGIWDEQLHVPLMIRVPGLRARRIAEPVSTVDVLPMLAGLVSFPGRERLLAQSGGVDRLADSSRGRPLFGLESIAGYRTGGGQRKPAATVLSGRWKLVHDPQKGDLLFDLREDPFELRSVEGDHPDTVEAMRGLLFRELEREEGRYKSLHGVADSAGVTPVDPEILEQLRALGYAN